MKVGDTKRNEYGSLLVLESLSAVREDCVHLVRRNGAWLVSAYLTDLTEDATPDELYDAAGSLSTAKRIARGMATDFGYTGAPRWKHRDSGRWVLEMTNVLQNWQYADEDEGES